MQEVKGNGNQYLPTNIEGIARDIRRNLETIKHYQSDLFYLEHIIRWANDEDFVLENSRRLCYDLSEISSACEAAMEIIVHNRELLATFEK